MAKSYPTPEPSAVAGYVDAAGWRKAGRPIASEVDYTGYCADHGEGKGWGPYGDWRAEVEATRASHDKRKADAPVQAHAPVKADAIPPAPVAVPMLRHERVKADEVRTKPLNVDLPVTTLAALRRYAAHHDIRMKVAVADMLDAMLTLKGFGPRGE